MSYERVERQAFGMLKSPKRIRSPKRIGAETPEVTV